MTARAHGSPPRAWGRFLGYGVRVPGVRFTPTCVGKILGALSTWSPLAVHPHVRGEDSFGVWSRLPPFGSPPRAWGRSVFDPEVLPPVRFTPTCVGKIRACCISANVESVHPHVRGEDFSTWRKITCRCGSPPRAWGRLEHEVSKRFGSRFTPTCVGKMTAHVSIGPSYAVHPHVRGEDQTAASSRRTPYGSPPRAWGRWQRPENRFRDYRFTPTCVGKIK